MSPTISVLAILALEPRCVAGGTRGSPAQLGDDLLREGGVVARCSRRSRGLVGHATLTGNLVPWRHPEGLVSRVASRLGIDRAASAATKRMKASQKGSAGALKNGSRTAAPPTDGHHDRGLRRGGHKVREVPLWVLCTYLSVRSVDGSQAKALSRKMVARGVPYHQ
jgi:hypothetical protein